MSNVIPKDAKGSLIGTNAVRCRRTNGMRIEVIPKRVAESFDQGTEAPFLSLPKSVGSRPGSGISYKRIIRIGNPKRSRKLVGIQKARRTLRHQTEISYVVISRFNAVLLKKNIHLPFSTTTVLRPLLTRRTIKNVCPLML